jgi:hypothetical protein
MERERERERGGGGGGEIESLKLIGHLKSLFGIALDSLKITFSI